MTLDFDHLKSWVGRRQHVDGELPPEPASAMAAMLDEDGAPRRGDELPPLWHWIYFLDLHRQSEIAEDGHARRGGFVPPVPLPRRMFAGAQITFPRPLRLGEPARRVSLIESLTLKQGRSGQLAFLRIRVEIGDEGDPAIIENQDIVYREAPKPGEASASLPPPGKPAWRETVVATEALLFRYSALIFNAHRIHYDRPYAVGHEGYAGLVVHGQLVATMLAKLARRNVPGRMAAFRFRAVRPILDTGPFHLCGRPAGPGAELWAEDDTGSLAFQAHAEFDGSSVS